MENEQLIVSTKKGKIRGFEENNVNKWFGIPYAKPPVNQLRFKRAQEHEAWEDIKNCYQMGNRPYQFMDEKIVKLAGSDLPSSEDCLNLNVWAPKNAKKAPVFVWLYGGGYMLGEASVPMYFLDSFAKKGIIGVSFNYHEGPLGFYNFSNLNKDFDSNCAMSDMILAMHWVKDNIAAFGGDPDNITIAGESAGGTAVYALLTAPTAKGTFNKAIAMSGLPGNITTQKTHDLNNEIFFEKLGINATEVTKLKEMPVENMISAAATTFSESNHRHPGVFPSGPVINDLLPQSPWDALAAGARKDIPCIFGTCRDEGTLFLNDPMDLLPQSWNQVAEMLSNNDQLTKLPVLKEIYQGLPEKKAMAKFGRDHLFWVDSIKCTLAQSEYAATYSYRFDYASPVNKLLGFGARHGSEVQPALNTKIDPQSKWQKIIPKPELKKIRDTMHGAFVNFAITGDPNGGLSPNWPAYTKNSRATFVINKKNHIEFDPTPQHFEVWKDIKLYE